MDLPNSSSSSSSNSSSLSQDSISRSPCLSYSQDESGQFILVVCGSARGKLYLQKSLKYRQMLNPQYVLWWIASGIVNAPV